MAGAVTLPITFFTLVGANNASDFDVNFNALLTPMNTLATFSNYAVDSGAANAIVLTFPAPQIVSYTDGLSVQAKIAATNTSTAVNLNVNSLGNVAVINGDGTLPLIGQLTAGMFVQFMYSAAVNQFQIVGQSRTASASSLVGPVSITTSSSNALTVTGVAGSTAVVFNSGGGTAAALLLNGPTSSSIVASMTGGGATVGAVQQFIDGQAGARIWDVGVGQFVVGAFSIYDQTSGIEKLRITGGAAATTQTYGPVAAGLVDATHDAGSFTATLTGLTVVTTGTVNWRRSGQIVVLFITASINGTSNSVNLTMTGLPAIIRPNTSQPVCWSSSIQDNGFNLAGTASISNAGVITFGLGNTSVAANRIVSQQGIFTNSGAKGLIAGWTITYTTD
jgi:hypothetical protein